MIYLYIYLASIDIIVEEEINCTQQIDNMAIHSKDTQSKPYSYFHLSHSRKYFYSHLIFKLKIIFVILEITLFYKHNTNKAKINQSNDYDIITFGPVLTYSAYPELYKRANRCLKADSRNGPFKDLLCLKEMFLLLE